MVKCRQLNNLVHNRNEYRKIFKIVQMYLNIALAQKKIEKILILLGLVLFNDDFLFLIKINEKQDKEKGEKKKISDGEVRNC